MSEAKSRPTRVFSSALGRVASINMLTGTVKIRDLDARTDQDPHFYTMADPMQYISYLTDCGWVVRR